MDNFVIGVDGGGTKTEAVLVTQGGNIISRALGGSTNYQAVGGDKLKREILNMIDKLLKGANVPPAKITNIFLGLAGAGRKSDQETIERLFKDTEFQNSIVVDSDAIIALSGAFANQPGIILIAGTGAICFGRNSGGRVVRSGGWGYLLGDEGSGYYIGREAILAALKDLDGRGDRTSLRKEIEVKFQLRNIDEIIPRVYQQKIDRVAIADLTPMVFDEAKKGDEVAQMIIKQAGSELGKLAKSVAQKLGFSDDAIKVALIGSLFKQKEELINEIAKELYEISWDIEILDPQFGPSIGAAILALEKAEVEISEMVLANLANTAQISIS
ncbi:hypothetical protein JW960_04760 [candidate division KSB1 bacterium]|nr:hypothetical protein [candidate division KSB1 bacterium]